MMHLSQLPLLPVLGPLVEAALRSAALIGIAALVTFFLRRAPAAARHLVWTLALVGCVAMPLATPLVPGWSVPGLPAWTLGTVAAPTLALSGPPATAQPSASYARPAGSDVPAATALPDRTPASYAGTGWRLRSTDLVLVLPLVWLAGVLLLLGRLALGWIRLTRLARGAARMDDHAWQVALARHGATLGLGRLPELRVSPRVPVPIVCGARRPVILVPAAATAWSIERRDAVLLHELAHVRRLDLITARIAQLAAALYWFHPAVWHAARAQRAEAELACDAQVLDAGGRPSAYATDLLEIAQAIGQRVSLDAAALAMARRSQLEGRLLAILDPRRPRGGAGPWTVAIAMLVAVGTIGAIAATRPAQGRQAPEAAAQAAAGATTATPPQVTAAPEAGGQAKTATHAGGAPLIASPPSRSLLAAAATLLAGSSVIGEGKGDTRTGSWSYKDGHGAMLSSRGTVTYSPDLDDITGISPGGWVEAEEKRDGTWRKARFKGTASGIERTYWVDGKERPWDADGRAWLGSFLIEIDRGSGTFADVRFPRLMSEGGPARVLKEMSLMTSDYGRGLYYRRLLAADLNEATMRQAVAQAGREIESDYELAGTLIEAARHHALDDPATCAAYLDAVNSLESDYEHGRTLMVLVERGELSPVLVDGAIGSAAKMSSDYERAQVMIAMAEKGHVKPALQRGFIRGTHTLSSDYERGRVLRSLIESSLSGENVGEMLTATLKFASDYERASVLVELARSVPMSDTQRAAFVESTRSMSSDYERDRALAALGKTFSK